MAPPSELATNNHRSVRSGVAKRDVRIDDSPRSDAHQLTGRLDAEARDAGAWLALEPVRVAGCEQNPVTTSRGKVGRVLYRRNSNGHCATGVGVHFVLVDALTQPPPCSTLRLAADVHVHVRVSAPSLRRACPLCPLFAPRLRDEAR